MLNTFYGLPISDDSVALLCYYNSYEKIIFIYYYFFNIVG